jgi:hypothetical protein
MSVTALDRWARSDGDGLILAWSPEGRERDQEFALPAQQRIVVETLLVAADAFGLMVDVREPEPQPLPEVC